MKERFLLAVSWATFAWLLFMCYAFYMMLVVHGESLSQAVIEGDVGWAILICPAVWLVLWIVTGSPRILPWREWQAAPESCLGESDQNLPSDK